MARRKKNKNKNKNKNTNLWFEHGELPAWVEDEEDIKKRLDHYSKSKRAITLEIENIIKSGDEELVFKKLKPQLAKKAENYADKWVNYRLSQEDFESAFWEESWKIIESYIWRRGSGKFLIYETLILAWDREAKDVVKLATMTKKGRVFHTALPLSEYFDEVTPDPRINVEEQVIFKLTVNQFMQEDLNPREKALFEVYLYDPFASLREIQNIVGYSKDTVRRTLERIFWKFKTNI